MHNRIALTICRVLAMLFTISSTVACSAQSSTDGSAPSAANKVTGQSGFRFDNGFANATDTIQLTGGAAFHGPIIELSSVGAGGHQAGAAWYKVRQSIASFTTDFTFRLSDPSSRGLTFCIQNTDKTTNPYWYGAGAYADANLLGYSAGGNEGQYPLVRSIAVKFDVSGGNAFGGSIPKTPRPTNSTGLYLNGGTGPTDNQFILIPEIDLNPSGIDLHSGHVMAAHMDYDGAVLTMTLRDTQTGNQFRVAWHVNIPAVTRSDTAWVGFTAGALAPINQSLLTWSFSEGVAPRAKAPVFSVPGGNYHGSQTVSLSASTTAAIYYTTDGSQPTTSSTRYVAAIPVNASAIIEAIAVDPGRADSEVVHQNYQISKVVQPVIDFEKGFANSTNLIAVNGSARFNGPRIELTDAVDFQESGTAWYAVPVGVRAFETTFAIQFTHASANGMTFAIQNWVPASLDEKSLVVSGGPNIVGMNQSGLGYQGILSSLAVKFDLWTGSGPSTGLYTNGASPTMPGLEMASSGIDLRGGDPFAVTITYDGRVLSLKLKNSKGHAVYSHSWPIDIPATVGGDTAYVGFTGSTGGGNAQQEVLSWVYKEEGSDTSQSR